MPLPASQVLTFGDKVFAIGDMSQVVRAAGIRGFGELMASRAIAPEPLLRAAGIPVEAMSDDDLRISLNAWSQVLEAVAEQHDVPDVGLQMAEQQDITILGPIAIAMQNAATVGEGIEVCARFLHTHSPGIRLTAHPDEPDVGLTALRMRLILPSWLPHRQVLDQCLADLHHFTGFLTQEPPPVVAVHLPHQPLAALQRYAQVFGCVPAFEQAQAELHVPSDFFARSLSGASEALHRLSVDYLQLRYEPGDQTVTEQVETVLRRALASTGGRRDVVAKLLRVHPRTLQRRLGREGSSFSEILDRVRRAEARRWLTQSDTPLSQVPALVGLADQAVLTRSCRRWFSATPAQVRATGVHTA